MKKIVLISSLMSSSLLGISLLCIGMALSNNDQLAIFFVFITFAFALVFIISLVFAIIELMKKE